MRVFDAKLIPAYCDPENAKPNVGLVTWIRDLVTENNMSAPLINVYQKSTHKFTANLQGRNLQKKEKAFCYYFFIHI